MKQLLNVAIDDNGRIEIQTADEQTMNSFIGLDKLDAADQFFRRGMEAAVQQIWKEKNNTFSQIIRVLSMVEICACNQPYEMAEDFWSLMMFNFLPKYEEFADSLKKQYGFNSKEVIKPISFGNTGFFSGGYFPVKLPS